MRKFVAAHVLERVISIHSIRLLFVFNSPLECLGVSLCLWAPSFRTRNLVVTHLFWLFIFSFSVLYAYAKVCSRSCFRTSNIHTLHSLVICVRRLSVLGFCYVCGRLFLERVIFTHLFACLFVTGRHEPSRIVAVGANLATRHGSSRSVNFFRGRCTLPEVHFRYPFSRHDFRYEGRERFVTGRQSVTIRRESSPLLRPVTDRVYWT